MDRQKEKERYIGSYEKAAWGEMGKTNLLSEYGRQRLIGYAESFGAIAQSLYGGDKLTKIRTCRPGRVFIIAHV